MKKWSSTAIAALLLLARPTHSEERPPGVSMIGILEEAKVDGMYRSQMRPVFRRVGGSWQAMPQAGAEPDRQKAAARAFEAQASPLEWSVCYQGEILGPLRTAKPERVKFWDDVGIQLRDRTLSIPRAGQQSLDFAGQAQAPVVRPLVSSLTGQCVDPEKWQRVRLPKERLPLLKAAMRKATSGISRCDKRKVVPYVFPDEDIWDRESYVSNKGVYLVTAFVRLPQEGLVGGCDRRDDLQWSDQLFLIEGDTIRYLGTSMRFLDAGDYDGDGRTEVLVKFWRDNGEGYTLYYDDFRTSVSFSWNYHKRD